MTIPSSPQEMSKFLDGLSDQELREMFVAQQQLEQQLKLAGPQTDDELHLWIKENLGIDISRTAVCENHNPPFNFIADIYFERVDSAMLLANRAGGKTFAMAIIHWVNSMFKPGMESVTFAAIEAQSLIAYSHMKNWIYDKEGNKRPEIKASMMRETTFSNGSIARILGSTPECHPPDEPILTLDGYKPISELDPNVDKLASYKKRNNFLTWGSLVGRRGKFEIAHPFELGVRPYKGSLITVTTDKGRFRVTPNHILRISLKEEFKSRWIVYLMRKGDWWRIGKTTGKTITRRLNEERGDALWILGVFTDEASALEAEAVFQAEHGITGVCFAPYKHTNARINDASKVHDALKSSSTGRAATLLREFHMQLSRPFVTRNNGVAGRIIMSGNGWFDTIAGNIRHLGGLFVVPIADKDFEKGGNSECRPLRAEAGDVEVQHYSGMVYSIEVNPLHYYIANGHVVHNSVNGPHPQLAHADEVELMREDTYSESRNMTSGKRLGNGRVVRPQDIYTSTRKGPNGRMQKLIDEIEEAKQAGLKPPRVLYQHCLKESAAQNPGCQVARPDLPEDQACDCHKVAKGQWENGQTRYLKDVCGGDFHRSRGWQPFTDVIKQFTENDKDTFEVQQLCAKPEMRHHYVPNWKDDRHLVRDYIPDPDNGPIFTSTDWGGSNPHAVSWYQLLRYEVEALAWNQPDESDESITIRIKEGTLVCFDEIYIAEIGNDKLGDLVIQKENEYKKQFPNFKPWARFADPQGKAARMDWKAKGLKTSWHTTREFEEHIKILRDMFDDDLFRCDGQKCPMFVKEVKEWRADPKSGNQIDVQNHQMSSLRYAISNIKKIKGRALGTHGNLPTSRSIARKSGPGVRISRPTQGPIATRGTGNEMDNWRKSLGGPVRRNS